MDDPAAALRVPAAPPPATVAAEAALRALAPATVPHPPPAAAAAAGAAGGARQIFSVELRPGETTIVSWKKLLKEAGPGAALPPSLPAATAAAAQQVVVGPLAGQSGAVHPAENDPNDPSQSNRFNSVIEKIERLYMGKHSSDEEDMDDVPDDDQYDTEDSFIDDAELDEYFEVDNLATKHTGFFVNKGKLEQSEYGSVQNDVPDGSVQNVAPKKRRRRDPSSSYIEHSQEIGPGSMAVKPPKRNTLEIRKNELSSYSEYHSEGSKPVKNGSNCNSTGRMQKINSSDNATGAEYASHLKIPSKDVSLPSSEIKDLDKHKTAALQAVDFSRKSRTNDTYPYPAYMDKDAPVQLDLPLKKSSNGAKQDLSKQMRRKENYGASQFSGLATTKNVHSTQTTQLSANRRAEGSGIKAKGTRLERAIRDLQNIVNEIEYRPQTLDVPEIDPNSQAAVKRRLPQEVKQKLSRVARLSVNQGKIPEDELINRLMGIVGHLVQRRTLKRNMKEMVESGNCAKQEKAGKLQQVKTEIYEMIKARLATKPKELLSSLEQKDESADDFQGVVNIDERRALKGKFVLDAPLEDRICDLYDLYVEGMDEDKGPQSRKLYVELADLWPQGYMDKVEIRDAISRSKQRRNVLYRQRKVRNEERMKRRRLAAAAKLRDGNLVEAQYTMAQQVMHPPIKDANPSMPSTHTVYPVVNYGHNQVSRIADKVGEMSVAGASDGNRSSSADIKRRKLGPDAVDLQANPLKAAPQRHGSEKQKPPKRVDEAKAGTSLPQTVPAVAGYDPQRPGYS